MSRTFAYCRVSTTDQTTDNQIGEIEAAGFTVEAQRIVSETVSGSVAAMQRPEFAKLVDRLEAGDVLIVSRLDRLGRNTIDVMQTVDALSDQGVKVYCLALGGADLTSAAGRMTMTVLAAVANFERDLLIERTQAGLVRAKANGKKLGRKPSLTEAQQTDVLAKIETGQSIAALAREFNTSRQSIMRVRGDACIATLHLS